MKNKKNRQNQIPISKILKLISWAVLGLGIIFSVFILVLFSQSNARYLYLGLGAVLSISLAAVLRVLAVIGQVVFEIGQRSYTQLINSQSQAESTHNKMDKLLQSVSHQNKQIETMISGLNDSLGTVISSLEQIKNIAGTDLVNRVDKIQVKQAQVECDLKEIMQDMGKLSHIFKQIAARLNIDE